MASHPLATQPFDPRSGVPLYRQLYDRLRGAILRGGLRPASRLPSTRGLAHDLGVARNTVLTAYELLLAEGYVTGHPGSGTYVSRALPDRLLRAAVPRARAAGAGGR